MKADEFYQQIENWMPWLPKLFTRVVKKLESFDPRQPVTSIVAMEKEINKSVNRMAARPKLLLRGMRFMMKHPYFATAMTKVIQDCIRNLEKQMAVDPAPPSYCG